MHLAAAESVTRFPFVRMEVNAHLRETPIFGDPEELLAGVAPASSTDEPRSYGAHTVVTPATLYLPEFRTDLSPHDEWEVRGVRSGVEGQPQPWRSPMTGWTPGTVIQLRKVDG